MNGPGKCLLGGLGLALVTGGMGYLGIRGWDGESGGSAPLLLPGLPLIWVGLATGSWALGCVAQAASCVALAFLAGVLMRWARGRFGPVREACEVEEGWVAPGGDEVSRVVGGRGPPADDPPGA